MPQNAMSKFFSLTEISNDQYEKLDKNSDNFFNMDEDDEDYNIVMDDENINDVKTKMKKPKEEKSGFTQ